jgi:hypothetical protein
MGLFVFYIWQSLANDGSGKHRLSVVSKGGIIET